MAESGTGSEQPEEPKKRGVIRRVAVNLLTAGMADDGDTEVVRKISLVNLMLFVGILALVPFGINVLFRGRVILGVVDLSIAFVEILAVFQLRRSRDHRLMSYLCIGLTAVLFMYLLLNGGIGGTGPLWTFAFPLFATYMLGVRWGSIVVGVFLLAVVVCFFPGSPIPHADYGASFLGRYLAAFLLVTTIALFAEFIRDRTQRHLEERNRQLQAANAEIETLTGFIPICGWCKKVRDDKGYWSQVESYVASHTGAKFTHGICPDCVDKVYPEHPEKDGPYLNDGGKQSRSGTT